jgi:molybdate transport system substrate-binding protein
MEKYASSAAMSRHPSNRPLSRRADLSPVILALGSVALLSALVGILKWMSYANNHPAMNQPLLVYCAVSVQPAVRQIAEAFERDTGIPVSIQTGSSGALETQIELSGKGDIFIPAAEKPYLDRARERGMVTQVVPLAQFELVLAVNPRVPVEGVTLSSVVDGSLRCAIANEEAAAGLVTRQVLEPQGTWPQVESQAKVFLPTVTAVALAVEQGVAVDAGFVWETTARQFKLPMVRMPELAAGRAIVAAGLLSSSQDEIAANQLLGYLTNPAQGGAVFHELGYTRP